MRMRPIVTNEAELFLEPSIRRRKHPRRINRTNQQLVAGITKLENFNDIIHVFINK